MSSRYIGILPALALNEGNKSKENVGGGTCEEGTPLKRAIKENEDAIIHSILSPSPPSTSIPSGKANEDGGSSDDKSNGTAVTKGLSPLLDYLFEDGQLTRVEYDIVDNAESELEQVQFLLKILVDTKDDVALEVLLDYLKKLDPSSESIRRLCATFPGNGTSNGSYCDGGETKVDVNESSFISTIFIKFDTTAGSKPRTRRDFYYGSSQRKFFGKESDQNHIKEVESEAGVKIMRREHAMSRDHTQANKEITDFRDFYLTNACLELVRPIILGSQESLTASGWERVLRNINGLLSTDVLSIKDLLFQIKSFDQSESEEEERRVTQEVRRIERERKQQLQGKVDSQNDDDEGDSGTGGIVDDLVETQGSTRTSERLNEDIKVKQVNWDQIIYHSLQMWKQRNGLHSTFYSLVGLFQHSRLYQTADSLLARKMGIQAKEIEKDPEQHEVIDANLNLRRASTASTSTMLEKSHFLRKFYSPSSRRSAGKGSPTNSELGSSLSTRRDRVSVSPVLSLDLDLL